VLDRIVSSTPNVFAASILITIVVVFSAEAHGAGGSLIHGTLQSALGVRGALERLTPTPWDGVWAKVPAILGARVSRDRRSRCHGARGTGGCMILPGARFVHGEQSALEHLLVEAAYGFLGLGPYAEFHEGEPARFPSVAVHRQMNGHERADGGEVRTQLRLGHVKGEIPHKKAYCHTVFSRVHEG